MSHDHIGASIAFISLLSTELWAFKVGRAIFFASKKFLNGKNFKFLRFLKIIWAVAVKPLVIVPLFSSQTQGILGKRLSPYLSSCGLWSP